MHNYIVSFDMTKLEHTLFNYKYITFMLYYFRVRLALIPFKYYS